MVDLVRLFSTEGKGSRSTYRPPAGTRCLISGPNEDNDDGYVFGETTVLWQNETFVLYGNEGFWPVLYKWEHVIAKPLQPSSSGTAPARVSETAEAGHPHETSAHLACGQDVGFNFQCRRERGHAGPCTWDPKRLYGEEPL